jgi:hypothetical protein
VRESTTCPENRANSKDRYALYEVSTYSIPIPVLVTVSSIILPGVVGFVVYLSLSHRRLNSRTVTNSAPSLIRDTVLLILFIAEIITATLFATYAYPTSILDCQLQLQWQTMNRAKDEHRIRVIQDQFECCGFKTISDMAWPFQADGFDPKLCSTRFQRTNSCAEDWLGKERNLATAMLVVNVSVFLWQIIVTSGLLLDDMPLIRWMPRIGANQSEFEFGEDAESIIDEPRDVPQASVDTRNNGRLIGDELGEW